MKTNRGEISNRTDILEHIKDFYQELYSEQPTNGTIDCNPPRLKLTPLRIAILLNQSPLKNLLSQSKALKVLRLAQMASQMTFLKPYGNMLDL